MMRGLAPCGALARLPSRAFGAFATAACASTATDATPPAGCPRRCVSTSLPAGCAPGPHRPRDVLAVASRPCGMCASTSSRAGFPRGAVATSSPLRAGALAQAARPGWLRVGPAGSSPLRLDLIRPGDVLATARRPHRRICSRAPRAHRPRDVLAEIAAAPSSVAWTWLTAMLHDATAPRRHCVVAHRMSSVTVSGIRVHVPACPNIGRASSRVPIIDEKSASRDLEVDECT